MHCLAFGCLRADYVYIVIVVVDYVYIVIVVVVVVIAAAVIVVAMISTALRAAASFAPLQRCCAVVTRRSSAWPAAAMLVALCSADLRRSAMTIGESSSCS